ncbi:hypothetical protein C8J57DRAFT_1257972 [Mycena rebaudengoi]|nr:hypothetical protein C8J57DRAFT_1257972 [Mycena rebaudengoi]
MAGTALTFGMPVDVDVRIGYKMVGGVVPVWMPGSSPSLETQGLELFLQLLEASERTGDENVVVVEKERLFEGILCWQYKILVEQDTKEGETHSQKGNSFQQELDSLVRIYEPMSHKCQAIRIIYLCFISIPAKLTEIFVNRSRGSRFAQNGNFLVRAFGTAISCNTYPGLPMPRVSALRA